MTTRACPDCGVSLETAHPARLRCEPCGKRKKVVASTAWHKAHPKTRACRHCGADISGTGLRVRCAACALELGSPTRKTELATTKPPKPKRERTCLQCEADISDLHWSRRRCASCQADHIRVVDAAAQRKKRFKQRAALRCKPVSEEPVSEAAWDDEPPKPLPAHACADCGRSIVGLPAYISRCAPCARKRYWHETMFGRQVIG
jgi:hypothetical protein